MTIWADDRYGEYEFVPGKGGRGPTGIAFGGGPDGGPGGGRTSSQPTGEEKAKAIAKEVLACTLDNYGLTAAGLSLAAAGANIIGTRGKPAGATPGTSLASMAARSIFGNREFYGGARLPSLTGFPGVGRGVRIMAVSNVGTFAGRAVPVVGYALLAWDAYKITRCVMSDD